MFEHVSKERVRYGHTDQMGYMYYGHYTMLYEIGRTEAMRSLGLSYSKMETELNVAMPVVSLNVRYLRPCFYDDLLTLKTQIRKFPEKFITFHTEIYNPDQKLINVGEVRLCFVSKVTKRTIDLPEEFTEKLKPFFE